MVPNYEQEKILDALTRDKASTKMVDLEFEKEKVKSQIIDVISEVTSHKQLDALKKIMAPAKSTIAAIANTEIIPFSQNQSKKIPHNKNIEKQRRFYKTKKISKRTSNQLVQPDANDMDTIAVKLLYPDIIEERK